MTEPEKKFSEEISDFCMAAKVTSGLPQLSTSVGEISDVVKKQFQMDDDDFDLSISRALMPKAMHQKLKLFPSRLRNWLKNHGFPRTEDGRGIEYLITLDLLGDAYAKEAEIQEEMKRYVNDMVRDWEDFRNKAINALGNLKDPEQYFPYQTKEQYLAEFHLKLHLNTVSNASMIPSKIVDQEIRARVEESMNYEVNFLLTRLEEHLAEELKVLHNRLLGTNAPTNTNTFNYIKQVMKKCSSLSMGRSDGITRGVAGAQKLLDYLQLHPDKLEERGTRISCDNTFNKIYSVLGAEEYKIVSVDKTDKTGDERSEGQGDGGGDKEQESESEVVTIKNESRNRQSAKEAEEEGEKDADT